MGSLSALIGKIYQAPFVPELWTDVLEVLVPLSGSVSAELMVYDGSELRHGRGSALMRDALDEYIASGAWRASESYLSQFGQGPLDDDHLHHSEDLLSREEFSRYTVGQALDRMDLGGQLVTAVPMPTGETVLISFERRKSEGRHSAQGIAHLSAMRPHLARAALLASQLGFERARGALAAMTALDPPAALIDRRGRLREANALMTPALLDTRGGERVVLGDPKAQSLLDACLAGHGPIRSIGLAPRGERLARVMHVVPLAPAVRDPMASATTLLVLNFPGPSGPRPDLTILRALFDLSPAESRRAALLVTGVDLAGAASECHVQISTARTHLERIFEKTACLSAERACAVAGGADVAAGGGPTKRRQASVTADAGRRVSGERATISLRLAVFSILAAAREQTQPTAQQHQCDGFGHGGACGSPTAGRASVGAVLLWPRVRERRINEIDVQSAITSHAIERDMWKRNRRGSRARDAQPQV